MFSVVMPAYNVERFVARAIESVLSQTYADFELIVIDDGSSDGTASVIERYANQDPRIRLVRQTNAGIAPTLNRGLEMARGEWAAIMHADDMMLANRLERQSAFIAQNPDLAVASSLAYYVNDRDEVIGRCRSPYVDRSQVGKAIDRNCMIAFCHPATAVRRSAVLAAGGYRQEFWPAEDADLWTRLAEAGCSIAVQPEYLLNYRIHGSSASISRNRLMQQRTLWIEACMRARRAGVLEPTFAQFTEQVKKSPLTTRCNHARREWGKTLYQASLHHLATRAYHRCLPLLAGAAALSPGLVLSRALPRLGLGR